MKEEIAESYKKMRQNPPPVIYSQSHEAAAAAEADRDVEGYEQIDSTHPVDAQADDVASLCSLSKCKVGDFLHVMSNQLIQIHGGIGMTDEFDAGFYLKRARVLEHLFGNQAFHRTRFATLSGF